VDTGNDKLLAVAEELKLRRFAAAWRDQLHCELLEWRASAERNSELRRVANPAEHGAAILKPFLDAIEHRAAGGAISDIDIERRRVARQAAGVAVVRPDPVPQQDFLLVGVVAFLPFIHHRPFAVARQRRVAVPPHGYPGFCGA
jgi:hypothetical protein